MVKNPPYYVGDLDSIPGLGRSPGGDGMATHSSILAWRIPMDRGAWWATVHRVAKSWETTERLSPSTEIVKRRYRNV